MSNQSPTPRRFVVLRHETPTESPRATHWDFMIEFDGALRTWALSAEPDQETEIAAEPLVDHRLAYLDYEGPIAGNRGSVARWDRGTYEVISSTDDCCLLQLVGERLRGTVRLSQDPGTGHWTFRFSSGRCATSV